MGRSRQPAFWFLIFVGESRGMSLSVAREREKIYSIARQMNEHHRKENGQTHAAIESE